LTIETNGAISGPLIRKLKLLKKWLLAGNQRLFDDRFVKAFAVLLPHADGSYINRHRNRG
jgi:hypothetical protein